jgi:hypothetical protein
MLRREFICRVLSDHPMAACRILGQYGTRLHTRIINERTARTGQGKRRRKFFEQRARRAEAYRAETQLALAQCRGFLLGFGKAIGAS